MAFADTTWYCNAGDQSTTGYYAVVKWAAGATIAAGALRRQLAAPAVNNERVFVCIVAGTTNATTEPSWTLTRGAKTTDNTVTWQECTGASAVNGDLTNTPNWTAQKALGAPSLGSIIKRNSGTSYQICTTAGSMAASEPSFSDTAGVTTSDGTSVWTSLGVVGNFTGGQAPHARLQNACASTWFTAGNTIYVGDNHAETQSGSINYGPSGNLTTTSKILCHNHSGSYPPTSLTTGAAVTVTGSFVGYTFNPAGQFYIYGLTYNAGSGANACYIQISPTSGAYTYFDNCLFAVTNTATSQSYIQVGAGSGGNSNILWNNCTVKFGATAQFIAPGYTWFTWQSTGQVLASGSSVPTSFFTFAIAAAASVNQIIMEALDLSQLTGALCAYNTAAAIGTLLVKDCKLNASMTIPQPDNPGSPIQIVRSDSGATGYKSARYAYDGTETTETSITRVGGASDPTGQAQSRKIVTTANSTWLRPFKAEPYAIWNPTTAANVTVTVCGTINAGTLPNNDDIWLDVEYLGNASFPVGTIVNTTKASVLAANAAVASDGSTWSGGGSGAGWSPFKLTTTLSSPQPGFAGYLHARVRAAKASTTWYIDPKITLS